MTGHAHLYPLGRYLVPRILEVKHGPEFSVRVRLADLVQRRVVLVDDFVDGGHNARVLDGPP